MKITNEQAYELLELGSFDNTTTDWDNFDLNFKLIKCKLIDTTRWSHVYERVYQDLNTDKFYRTTYRCGATECQDERPYEYDGETIEFEEVEPYEVVIVKYRKVESV